METIQIQLDVGMLEELEERAESLHLFASEYASLAITSMIQDHKTRTPQEQINNCSGD